MLFNKIQKAIEAKIEKTDLMRTLRAQQAASGVEIGYDDFCEAVDTAIAEEYGQSWPYRMARYGHIMSAEEVRTALNIKAGLLRHIPWVSRKIEAIAKECDGKYNSSLFAETMTVEQGGIDEVIFYYDYFAEKWWALNPDLRDWKLAIKEIVRHEYRHVEQIKELRRRGGAQYVHAALKAHMRVTILNYKSDPMEADAYANQAYAPADQSDLKAAVDKIVANF